MPDLQPAIKVKKPYNQPQVTEVRLVSKEATLGGCKSTFVQAQCNPDYACVVSSNPVS